MKLPTIAAAVLSVVSVTAFAADDIKLTSQEDKLSYTIGVDLGTNFKAQEIEIDTDVLLRGIQDALQDKTLLLSDEEMDTTLQQFQEELLAKRAERFEELAKENETAGSKFLAANKTKKGVKTTDSGLQYRVVKAGTGKSPTESDVVTVEYTGKLIDGTVFDSSERSGQPATFTLSQIIPGWQEALQMMKEGGEWEVFIPAELAYGSSGFGVIGPNETLIFNIKLISVEPATAATAQGN
jgi:FKBP-type peptidyl-prolyl cis-trans isomerase FklB